MSPLPRSADEVIPILRPDVGEAEAEAAARVVRSGRLVQGEEVAAFEAELAARVHAPHAVAVASGTVALELALRALGVGPGDEVVTVSHSFVATANAVLAVGARPVFVDIDPATFGMGPGHVEAALTPRTRALLCVHQFGLPCDIQALAGLASRHALALVEDAACALGSEVSTDEGWRRIGRPFGALACFSFHPLKLVTTGEGGMLTSADAALADRLRGLRDHGRPGPRTGLDPKVHLEPGFNHRLSDVHAAIGRPQLARLDTILERRRALADRLDAALAGHPVLSPPQRPDGLRWNRQSYPVRVRSDAGMAQAGVIRFLLERGVSARPGIANAHEQPAYRERPELWRVGPAGLAVSESASVSSVLLPLFQALEDREMESLLAALADLRPGG